jgi:hypothetical protein
LLSKPTEPAEVLEMNVCEIRPVVERSESMIAPRAVVPGRKTTAALCPAVDPIVVFEIFRPFTPPGKSIQPPALRVIVVVAVERCRPFPDLSVTPRTVPPTVARVVRAVSENSVEASVKS